MAHTFIDALGFAGGFTLGMVQAGFELVGKREMKGGFGVPNCEANRHLLGNGWRSEAIDPAHIARPDPGSQRASRIGRQLRRGACWHRGLSRQCIRHPLREGTGWDVFTF